MTRPIRRHRTAVAVAATTAAVLLPVVPAAADTTVERLLIGTSSGTVLEDPDGSQRLAVGGASLYSADLSPDGTRIAYADQDWGVSVMNVDGTGAHQIARLYPDGSEHVAGVRWNHAGTAVAWEDHLTAYPSKTVVTGVDGATLARFTGGSPSWSPDDSRLAVVQDKHLDQYDTVGRVVSVAADGSDPRQLVPTSADFSDGQPTWVGGDVVFDRISLDADGGAVGQAVVRMADTGGATSTVTTLPVDQVLTVIGADPSGAHLLLRAASDGRPQILDLSTGSVSAPIGRPGDYPLAWGRGPGGGTTVSCTITAGSGAVSTVVGSARTFTLPAPSGANGPIARWTLGSAAFDPTAWNFSWGGDGTFALTAPSAGTTSLTYTVTDAAGCTSAPATETVTAVAQSSGNHAPIANPDSMAVNGKHKGSVNVLANDSDPDGDRIAVTKWTTKYGKVSCSKKSGVCTYTPRKALKKADHFTYTIADPHKKTAKATVTVTPKQ